MILNWLRGRRELPITGMLWKSDDQQLAGVGGRVSDATDAADTVALICHFTEPFHRLSGELDRLGIAWSVVDEHQPSRQVGRGGGVWLIHADQLVPEPPPESKPPTSGDQVLIVLFDLHCLPDRRAAVRRFAGNLGRAVRIEQHTSLDDPMIKPAITPMVRAVLDRLGWPDGEALETPMIQRSIDKACAKLARRARADHPAESARQWIERNRD